MFGSRRQASRGGRKETDAVEVASVAPTLLPCYCMDTPAAPRVCLTIGEALNMRDQFFGEEPPASSSPTSRYRLRAPLHAMIFAMVLRHACFGCEQGIYLQSHVIIIHLHRFLSKCIPGLSQSSAQLRLSDALNRLAASRSYAVVSQYFPSAVFARLAALLLLVRY